MPSVTVYKASAGSGKTFTLAVQYIRLLITTTPQEYRHTLAVTFTNKATAEMKDRILEQLYGIGHALPDSDSYLEALKKSLAENDIKMKDETIREKCLESLHFILHDYSRFRIETIDSFFQSVLRNLAHELGLNARLQVDLNDKQILSQAVDNMIDGLGNKKENDVLPWMEEYVKEQIENADNWDVRNNIKSLASIIFKEEFMRRGDTFRQNINNEELIKEYRKKLYAMRNSLTNIMKEIVKLLNETIRQYPGNLSEDVSRGAWIGEYRDKLLGEDYSKAITEKRMEALEKGAENLVKKKDIGNTAMLKALEPVCKVILDVEKQRIEFVRINNTIDLSLKHLSPLRLLNHIDNEVTEITNESNRFILSKTPILLSRLIEGNDAPFVFEKMGTLFNNVMIDEFQDTSRLQWENFKVLLLESQAKGGQNLLVGDVKQSIYRFRNGDWHILKNIDSDLNLPEEATKNLDTNFRSDANVIAFNNSFFTEASMLLDTEECDGIVHDIYSDVVQKWNEKNAGRGFVRFMIQNDKMEDWNEAMLSDLCEQIKTLKSQGLPYNKMAILVRNRTHVSEIIDYVMSHIDDVKMISDEGFYLSNSLALSMLIAALRMLVFGTQDPVSERFLIQHYLNDISGSNIDFQEFISSTTDVLPKEYTEHQDELRHYPLNELCEKLYRIFNLERIKGEDAYILSFFDELSNFLRNGTSDIHSFLEYWETDMQKKAIPACQIEGISIITIHKSKGLQYHTVFMPFCDEKMEEVRDTEVLWCDTQKPPYNDMGTLPINGSKKKFEESLYYNDYHEEQLQRRIEELNSLYVAFTRPEHNLYVWGDGTRSEITYSTLLHHIATTTENHIKAKLEEKKLKSVEDMMQVDQHEGYFCATFGEPVTPKPEEDKAKTKQPETEEIKNPLTPDFEEKDISFCSFDRRYDFQQSNEASQYIRQQGEDYEEPNKTEMGLSFIEQGKLLHEIFSNIKTISELDNTLKSYIDRGILSSQKQVNNIRKWVNEGMSNDVVKGWFDGHLEVINECEIVHLDDDGKAITHRPDRVMLSDEEVIVVDFKFGRPNPEKYNDQVRGYMELLQSMYPDRKTSGYLWYVYNNIIETVSLCS